jgi:transcription elongation factor GreA
MTTNYLTAEAYKKLKEELEYLRKVKRKEIAQRVQEAKELGDLSENADYQKAKEDQAALESRIIELEEFLKRAVIIQPKKTDRVEIGSIIEVENLSQSTSKKQVFTIVGSHEAQPLEGRISNESPLGKAFLGKKVGEIIDVETPKGKVQYKILKIK